MVIPQNDYSRVLSRIVLTFSTTIVAGVIVTIVWMLVVPDVGEASFAVLFTGAAFTIFSLMIECVVLAVIYRKHRWIAVSLVCIPFLLSIGYIGFLRLLS